MRILKLSSPRSTHEQRVPHPLIFKGAGLVFEFPLGGRICISSTKLA